MQCSVAIVVAMCLNSCNTKDGHKKKENKKGIVINRCVLITKGPNHVHLHLHPQNIPLCLYF